MATQFSFAPEVRDLAEEIIRDYHPHLGEPSDYEPEAVLVPAAELLALRTLATAAEEFHQAREERSACEALLDERPGSRKRQRGLRDAEDALADATHALLEAVEGVWDVEIARQMAERWAA